MASLMLPNRSPGSSFLHQSHQKVGFDSLFFAQMDYQDMEKRNIEKTLKFVWQGLKSPGFKVSWFIFTVKRARMTTISGWVTILGSHFPTNIGLMLSPLHDGLNIASSSLDLLYKALWLR
ncbi:hypothetical protein QVD17_06773 [Tagetes erecta]|uniref:Uncharacterized protein n=1 Tax=Tagetes erecta TaxID=13708 RepID=A0AAD8LGL8_TARER|nr:hypothetical protein QVD17_06773 [Tagetes erecta]